MQIIVSQVFHTSLGVVMALDFPKAIITKINMKLKKENGTCYIKGVQFENPKQSENVNSKLYSCLLSDNACNNVSGDILELDK